MIDIEYAKFCDAKYLLSQSVQACSTSGTHARDREEKEGREVERERERERRRESERERENEIVQSRRTSGGPLGYLPYVGGRFPVLGGEQARMTVATPGL